MATASLTRPAELTGDTTLPLPSLRVDPSVWEIDAGEPGTTDRLRACIRLGDLTLRLEAWAVDTVSGLQRARRRLDDLVDRVRGSLDQAPPYQTTTIVGRRYIVLAFGA
jgi:hypothetical protein